VTSSWETIDKTEELFSSARNRATTQEFSNGFTCFLLMAVSWKGILTCPDCCASEPESTGRIPVSVPG
jgi:hypothetical protein